MDIKYFDGITPKFIDKNIEKFCKKINYKSIPTYINVVPSNNSLINECVKNVKRHILINGGESVLGWSIWLHPHCMVEAEFHVVCKQNNGELVDITPHKDNCPKILFLEDCKINYKNHQINNIRQNISKSKLIDKCIDNWNKIYEISNKNGQKVKYGLLNIQGEDAQTIYSLNQETQNNLLNFYNNLKLKPNDLCICGSNQKFIDCCKKLI